MWPLHLHYFRRYLPEALFKIDILPAGKAQFLSSNTCEHDDLSRCLRDNASGVSCKVFKEMR